MKLQIQFVFLSILFCGIYSCTESKPNEKNTSAEVNENNGHETNDSLDAIALKIDNSNAAIEDIKANYTLVNEKLDKGQLIEQTVSYNCPDYPEEGFINFYSDSTGVRLIEHETNDGSHGGESTQYYLLDGELFFVYQVFSFWSFVEGSEQEGPLTQDHVLEYRYYFNNDDLFLCLEKAFSVAEDEDFSSVSANTPNQEAECGSSDELLERFNMLLSQQNVEESTSCIWE